MHPLRVVLPLLAIALLGGCRSAAVEAPASAAVPPEEHVADEERLVERNTFAVRVVGHGPDVVLIPGLTCGGHVWDATVSHLRGQRTVHVLTLAGFAGRPSAAGDEFLPGVRKELAEYLRGLQRPVVIGHSLGGFMALWLASTEPDALAGAVAVDGLPALGALMARDTDAIRAMAEQMRQQMAGQSQAEFAEQTAQTLLVQISDPDEARRVAEVSGRSDPAVVGQAMAELLTTDLRRQVARISAPVLLLGAGAGTASQLEARTQQYRAQIDAIPHHELVMVPDTRHFVMLDAPEVFLQHVDEFLERAQ